MTLFHPGLRVEIIWTDSDMLEVQLSVYSENFAGRVDVYTALDEPATFAKRIAGFPLTTDDVRDYQFGTADMKSSAGAKIRLYCLDGSGHLAAHVTVYRNSQGPSEAAESATVQFNTVPAAIDSFVAELQSMKNKSGEVAVLHCQS